jgi:hypothetical protein
MVSVADFLHDKTKSCGCYNRAQKTRHTIEPGQRFEHCTALRPISDTIWLCRCECGNEFAAAKKDLCTGHVTSCGCIQDETHKNIHEDLIDGTKISRLKLPARSASGHKGVYLVKKTGEWRASITFKKQYICLGTYDRIADAVAARRAAEEKYFAPTIEKYEGMLRERDLEKRRDGSCSISARGVKWYESKGKWRVRIKKDGKDINIGWYDTQKDAIAAREMAEIKYMYDGHTNKCIMCGNDFRLKVRDRRNRCVCHSLECWKLWQKWRKANNDFMRGKRKTKPVLAKWKDKHAKKDGAK